MPRDGSGVMTQPFPDVLPDTTVASTVYNGFVHDVVTDLNAARPIIAGGTGATDATTARANIKAEVATAIVTNYDSQIWEAGSFYSATTATSPPVALHAFLGTCTMVDQNNIVLEARDESDTLVPGRVYVREKKAGVWASGWTLGVDTSSYVLKAGDTMSGNLTIDKSTPLLFLNNGVDSGPMGVVGSRTSKNRWSALLGSSDPESTGNVGSNLVFNRFNDAGTLIDAPLTITRSTGLVTVGAGGLNVSGAATVTGALNVNGTLVANGAAGVGGALTAHNATITGGTAGAYTLLNGSGNPALYVRNDSDANWSFATLNVAGTAWPFTVTNGGLMRVGAPDTATSATTGALQVAGGIGVGGNSYFSGAVTLGNLYFTPGGTQYYSMYRDGATGFLTFLGSQSGFSGYWFYTNAGASTPVIIRNNSFCLNYLGAGTLVTDASGNVTASSDEQLKNVLSPFTRGLDALRAIGGADIFSWKHEAETHPDHRYAGFIAQKVQRAIPEAVGINPDGMLTLSDRPLIATLMNAVLELAAKVEELTKGK